MLYGTAAFQETGMPVGHGNAVQDVADRSGHAIIFRAVGKHATLLLEEGYAAKGFRIDTKSCDWGPMRGFVCVDPRLSKVGGDAEKVADNQRYTLEALEGRVRHDALGGLGAPGRERDELMSEWIAGCKPIVISADRCLELARGGLAGAPNSAGIVRGVSRDASGRVVFPWALVPVERCMQVRRFADACGKPPASGFGVFVDYSNPSFKFSQQTPETVLPIRVLGYEAVLGLINPGTESYGYRACVTGDYDLFAAWPPIKKLDPFSAKNDWDARIVDRFKQWHPTAPTPHHYQHYKLGNITGRLNMMKVLLNTAFIGHGGFSGGNLVHHSDEVGNPSPGLKKSLVESFPLLAVVPRDCWRAARLTSPGLCVRDAADFSALIVLCHAGSIAPDLLPEWAGLLTIGGSRPAPPRHRY